MFEEIVSKKLYNKYLEEKKFDAIAYLMEMLSLQTELYRLEISFREKYPLLIENFTNAKIPRQYLEDYFFFLKNCIYRIYDFQNKYALFINTISPYIKTKPNSLESQFPGWNTLTKNLTQPELSDYKDAIQKAISNLSLDTISKERSVMTHRKLVSPNSNYISSYVLPLGGETAKEKAKWISESRHLLKESISTLEILFSDTVDIILKEENKTE